MTCLLCERPVLSWLCAPCHDALMAAACRDIIDAVLHEENERRKGRAA